MNTRAPRLPGFYHYVIIVVGTGGVLASVVGQTIGVSAFTDHLVEALGLARTQLSMAYLLGTISSAAILNRAGRLYDRLGARVMGTATAALLGLTLIALSFLPAIVRTGSFAVAFPAITVGFFLLRFLGQGVMSLVSRAMVIKWFERNRGLANAVLGSLVTLGFSSSPLLFSTLIAGYGWTGAWRILGLVLALPVAGIILLLFRDNPQAYGLLPDGGPGKRVRRPVAEAPPDVDFTLSQAQRTLPFWVFTGLLTLSSLYFTGLTFHVVSVFAEAGLSASQALGIFLPGSFLAVPLSFLAGWASDRMELRFLGIALGAGMLLGIAAASLLTTPLSVVLLILGMGINGGLFGILVAVVWPRFFGLRHIGAITGTVAGFTVAGSALGPYLFSLSLDLTGSYRAVGIVSAFATMLLIALAPRARRPRSLPSVVAADNLQER